MGKETEQGNVIFSGTESLNREYVSFSTDVSETDNSVTHVGKHTRITKNGVVRIERGTCQLVGTVNLGGLHLLATEYEQQDLIRALPGWISQVQDEERFMGVPSHQLWRGIRPAFTADIIIGCNPLVAPACLKAALCGRVGDGWGHQVTKMHRHCNMLCLPPDLKRATVNRMRSDLPRVALTREKTLTEEAMAELERVGSKVIA